jgi:hypothetical protein
VRSFQDQNQKLNSFIVPHGKPKSSKKQKNGSIWGIEPRDLLSLYALGRATAPAVWNISHYTISIGICQPLPLKKIPEKVK